jgi:two-component system, cell cycle sensor histidine kinase and response regulator CckA
VTHKNKRKVRLMLVDDDLDSLKSLHRALTLHGFEADQFENPSEALNTYEKDRYDIIVTDFKMPDMNGLSLARAIREVNPKAKIVLFSGYIDTKLLDLAVNENIDRIFHKPIPIEEFFQSIEHLINNKKDSAYTAALLI